MRDPRESRRTTPLNQATALFEDSSGLRENSNTHLIFDAHKTGNYSLLENRSFKLRPTGKSFRIESVEESHKHILYGHMVDTQQPIVVKMGPRLHEIAAQYQAGLIADRLAPDCQVSKLVDAIVLDGNSRLMIVDYIPGDSLETFSYKSLTEKQKTKPLSIALALAKTALRLQESGIYHTDMHPENVRVLPDNGTQNLPLIGLIDFGVSLLPRLADKQKESRGRGWTTQPDPLDDAPETTMLYQYHQTVDRLVFIPNADDGVKEFLRLVATPGIFDSFPRLITALEEALHTKDLLSHSIAIKDRYWSEFDRLIAKQTG